MFQYVEEISKELESLIQETKKIFNDTTLINNTKEEQYNVINSLKLVFFDGVMGSVCLCVKERGSA